MKKLFIVLIALMIGGVTYAQVDPTLQEKQQQEQQELQRKQMEEQQKQQQQQQELLRKQQEEQQRLMEQQQKEQEKAQREALKEQERIQKEQAEAEKAAAKEQERLEREAEQQAKQEKAAEKAARREAIGRGGVLTISPYLDLATSTGDKYNLYHSNTVGIGGNLMYHYPIAKKWNVTAGLGYRFNYHVMTNHSVFDATERTLVADIPMTHLYTNNMLNVHNIEVPIRLERVTGGGRYIFVGVAPGFNISSSYYVRELNQYNEYNNNNELSGFTPLNQFRCDFSLGLINKRGRSIEFYYGLTPTYSVNNAPMHQMGFKFEFARIRFGSILGKDND